MAHLALKYAECWSNTIDPLSLFPQRTDHHRVEAAVGYGGAMWKASLASSYGLETDLMNHGAESQVKTQSITASLRRMRHSPSRPSLAIVPSSKNRGRAGRFAIRIPLHELHTEPADQLYCDGD